MAIHSITQSVAEEEHARWHADHLTWAADVQTYERTIDAALFDVELALWNTQYAKLDHSTSADELEHIHTTLNDLAGMLREHGDIIREHEVAIIQHRRLVSTTPNLDSSITSGQGHMVMALVHDDQCVFRERFKVSFDATLYMLRSLLEKRSSPNEQA